MAAALPSARAPPTVSVSLSSTDEIDIIDERSLRDEIEDFPKDGDLSMEVIKLMHSWGFAIREGVFAETKEGKCRNKREKS